MKGIINEMMSSKWALRNSSISIDKNVGAREKKKKNFRK